MKTRKKGYFITFEGNEGSGKSIQVEILASHLREEGYDVVVTREPGGTRVGEHIRSITHDPENVDLDPRAEAYLMAAARAQHVSEVILPALKSGKIVICDRFLDSSTSYQGYGRDLGEKEIKMLNNLALQGVSPNLTVLLDVPVEVGLARRRNGVKKIDRLDLQQKSFYERVSHGYKQVAKNNPDRVFMIPAKNSIEDIAQKIWEKVKSVIS